MKEFQGRTAVITGAASGFGLEAARIAARLSMNVVMADVQADALELSAHEVERLGARVLPYRLDVSQPGEVEALAAATRERFGVPHFVFNNAGVGGTGGLLWENSAKDWTWVIGVNVWGVIHGIRCFVPMMLDAAAADPAYEGHVVNTASMAGLLSPPCMGVYNASKHAVVTISETLYQDLRLVTDQVHAHLLCPFFVPTGIHRSQRNRPPSLTDEAKPTRSQLVAQALSEKAVTSGKVSAADVAQKVFDALRDDAFYVFSHPRSLGTVQQRMEDIVALRNPTDPFKDRPEVGVQLRAALRASGQGA